jgi:hypothetical protein
LLTLLSSFLHFWQKKKKKKKTAKKLPKNFSQSVAFWSRLAGSDKILVFQTDVAVCSGGAWQLQQQHEQLKVGEGGDGDDNSDERSETTTTTTTSRSMSSIRGGGRPPKLVRDFASKLDYVGGRQLLEYFVGSPPELVRVHGSWSWSFIHSFDFFITKNFTRTLKTSTKFVGTNY